MFFSIECGWLRYEPHSKFQLPRLVHVDDESGNAVQAPFVHKKEGRVSFSHPLYKLEWPGTMYEKHKRDEWSDWVPDKILKNLDSSPRRLHPKDAGYSLRQLIFRAPLPRRLP